ncbi:hypothetical protein MIDIC_260002 [Alphaproteobacteria bacterium]
MLHVLMATFRITIYAKPVTLDAKLAPIFSQINAILAWMVITKSQATDAWPATLIVKHAQALEVTNALAA